jgi:DNA-binding MurR/RpiR family transcriptional regulator
MLISQKIEDITRKSTDSKSSIGKFLLKEQRNLERYSMRDIADMTFTSQASLVRFAKKLGYEGWTEFIKEYIKEIRYFESQPMDVDYNFPFQAGDSNMRIAENIAKVRRDANRDTLMFLNETDLRHAVELMRKSERIVLCNSSINVALSQLFQHKMLRIGRIVDNMEREEQAFLSYALSDKDCVIMISYSGNSDERMPTSILKYLKENNVPVIGITSMGDNLLRSCATYTFTISSRERLYHKIASFATEESISVILDSLYSCYFATDYEKHINYKNSVSKKIEKRRITSSIKDD